ncbi:cytochrome P450 [Trametes versicolor FP-101664 SS1]|uniref:cytochrome P450 n=1 Tax=Trametes versicolor (strain FP-101664) TaxID=717944 RepID=UPI0004622556|nr:cytochrome P450 [Trametes versicolor FP-101664 SS1]EIW62555.1 cytochrome P450 [Trametes versicolor FP-101664 SS1]
MDHTLSFLQNISATSPELAVVGTILGYAAWRLYRLLSFVYMTPLRVLPGPPVPSLVYGNLNEFGEVEGSFLPDQLFAKYGKNYVDHEFFMTPRLWTLDSRAINHVLMHSTEYGRPEETVRNRIKNFGKGILFVQGQEHRQQRRIMNPAFGPTQVRDLTAIFVQKSTQLRDIWATAASKTGGAVRVDVSRDISKATLDIIGMAGFNYDFQALDAGDTSNELSAAFQKLFTNLRTFSLFGYLMAFLPIFKLIPNPRLKKVEEAADVINRVGSKLVTDQKAATAQAAAEKHVQGPERKDLQGRDLLTLLIKANMATDIPDNQKMTDEDVISQIPTFLIAGHETTSTSTTWALYAFCKHPEVQRKLREELLAVENETPTMEDFNALPYLDGVIRETLRLYAPITQLSREAKKDDVIPLNEPMTDRYGKVHHEIRIAKGNKVMLPILAANRSKEIWGEHALEFKPERWIQPSAVTSTLPGVWGHLLTFIGGPRACIGYRFALVELKALLFFLVRAFEFEFAVPAEDVVNVAAALQRPSLRSAPKEGAQLPLVVKPYKAAA